MLGFSLQWDRCPDGVELIEFDPTPKEDQLTIGGASGSGPWFRFRSDRIDTERYDINNLEDPIVVRFVNAKTTDRQIRFLSRYGFPTYSRETSGIVAQVEVEASQSWARQVLEAAASDDQRSAIKVINAELSRGDAHAPAPCLDFAGEGSRPRMALVVGDLANLMLVEMALVVINAARLGTCEHCGDVFLTGQSTGRRSTAKYCSDAHRVAAMRARKNAAETA